MVLLTELWLPIVVSAILVFIASALAWMVMPHHRGDWGKLPNEDELMATLRKQGASKGQYTFPHAPSHQATKDPAWQKKLKEGPGGMVILFQPGGPQMGKNMALHLMYCLVISTLVAYLAGRTLAAGTEYLAVFRVAGTAAILAYSGALPVAAIWFGRSWSSVFKEIFDGVVYGLLTAGVFGWLWP
jgi:hypothetical protein